MKILSVAVAIILFMAAGATAETTNDLSDAEIQGQQLAKQLLEQSPATNFTQNGTLKIRDSKGMTTNIPIFWGTLVTTGYWRVSYVARQTNYDNDISSPSVELAIIHRNGEPNEYDFSEYKGGVGRSQDFIPVRHLHENQVMIPFVKSDFWIADLGMEFFHWPEQKILKRENSRTRICKVLESTNPNPSTNGYSRVDSWIDEETLGIVQAYAYDAQGRKLKEFYPKDFKKDVNGQWQVGMMEMINVQTKSRSQIEFDLKN